MDNFLNNKSEENAKCVLIFGNNPDNVADFEFFLLQQIQIVNYQCS
jgi:hypothetical protein